ncbi:MAG: phenylalanine--tRNA ligase subunit beta [Gammaproteobacteria bacterium]
MYVSQTWLREFVDADVDTDALAERLTMAGLEVGSVEPAAEPFTGVVTGHVENCEPHPDADKLRVCVVNIGTDETQSIVCGAPNVRTGLKVAVATVGARLPGGLKIRKAKLRGVVSMGMICSARELGLGDEHDGILELPDDAPVGADVRGYLDLDDTILELELTPNRGDCLGMQGVAREVGVLFEKPVTVLDSAPAVVNADDRFDVRLSAPAACPRYAGRVVRGIDAAAVTPLWMRERLRRAGVRPISPVVDITNYVMLETGQPMHGFDLARLAGHIDVRMANAGETLTLLDGKEIKLSADELVIADDTGPLALAGVMGGENSGVADDTVNVFFESAFFSPDAIAGRARRHGLHTDASHRYERGVDPTGQVAALERATELLQHIAGGDAGPLTVAEDTGALPTREPVAISRSALDTRLGVHVPTGEVTAIFERLGFTVTVADDAWQVVTPSHRFDVHGGEDLAEEVARVHGYNRINEVAEAATLSMPPVTETRVTLARIQDTLVDRGLQEVITYSFVDPQLHEVVCPGVTPLPLTNPISADLAVMRSSLWPGLVSTLQHNLARQQERVRVFETGLVFHWADETLTQPQNVAFALTGARLPEHWDHARADVDVHDAAGHIEALLALRGVHSRPSFVAAEHSVLHPGQSANVVLNERIIGRFGTLHPERAKRLDLPANIVLGELDLDEAFHADVPRFVPVGKFPSTRRDVSVVVAEKVSVEALSQAVRDVVKDTLQELRVFDVYRGEAIDSGRKSVSFGLILQDSSRTLNDGEADAAVTAVMAKFKQDFDGTIRD